jgi:hypothetical protein
MTDNKQSRPEGEPKGHKPTQFAPFAPGGSPRPAKLTNKERKNKPGSVVPEQQDEGSGPARR